MPSTSAGEADGGGSGMRAVTWTVTGKVGRLPAWHMDCHTQLGASTPISKGASNIMMADGTEKRFSKRDQDAA